MTTNIGVKIQGLDQDILVARFEAHEGISELFQLDLLLVGDAAHPVDIDEVLGKDACFTLWGKQGARYLHGIVTRFQQADVQGRSIGYVATVAPRVHRLLHRHDCRIFQPPEGSTITVKDIIPKVLQAASLSQDKDFRLALRGTFTPRDYCAQYRESDWAFLCRLMEEEGIHFFFEHHDDKHVLVIADSAAAHDDLQGSHIRFHATMGALTGGDHIDRFHVTGSLRSDKFTVRDYNFEKPRDLLESTSKTDAGGFEIYDYPGGYAVPANGDQRAKIWLEEQRMQTKRGQGESRCQRLVPGYVFELREHPIEAMNRKYLITRVDHLGHSPDITQGGDEPPYENRFVAIPSDVPFRAPRITPRPVVIGVQTAVVICPSGDEVEPDKYGRVKVRFNWDRENKSSYWVRVGQSWAGAGFGAMFIPRKGQEVIVDFLEGDPDRPVIVGSLYHGVNVTPYNLPADKTKSTIKSSTVPGGGGFNELRFEDKKGSEEVYLHAQKDHNVEILNDEKVTIGHDQTVAIKNDKKLDVTGNETIHVGKNRTDAVDGDETLAVKGQRTRTVDKSESVTIKADQTLKVSGDLTENVDGNASHSVGKDRTDHVVGKVKERVDGDATLQFKGNVSTTIEGGETFEVKQSKTLTVGEKISITCGSAKVTVSKDGTISIEGGDVSISASSGITVKGGKLQVESSGAVTVKGGNVVVQGGTVGLN